jgi:acyl carrier protein
MNTEDKYLLQARQLLKDSLDLPELAAQIGDDDTFLDAGVNSGEIIQMVYRCEKLLGLELDDEEIGMVTSVRDVATVLRNHAEGDSNVA